MRHKALKFNKKKEGNIIKAISYFQEIDIIHQKLIMKQVALVNKHRSILLHVNIRLAYIINHSTKIN